MNHLDAYKKLRDAGFKVTVSRSRDNTTWYTVNAFNKTDDYNRSCGIVARSEGETIQSAIIAAAVEVNGHIKVLRECAEFVGETDFEGWVAL